MKVAAIVRVNLVRALRDRTALFFSVLLPLILILVLGLTYGSGSSVRLGVLDLDAGPMGERLVQAILAGTDLAVDVRRVDSLDQLRDAASRGIVEVAIAIPADHSAMLATGGTAQVTLVVPPTAAATAVRTSVDRAIARQAALVRAARFLEPQGDDFSARLARVEAIADRMPGIAIAVERVNAAATGSGDFDAGAQRQLVLFMFLTSLTAATELVLTRQLGVSRRMLSTPTPLRTIVVGESLARIAFALVQGVFIVGASALLFGVRWGDPAGIATVIGLFALVSGGAAMLIGSLVSNPSQAGAIGPALGMLLALLGGAMVPAEVFPQAMQTLSHVTPHAWAVEALERLAEPGAGAGTVLSQLGVLVAFALGFFVLATWQFRRTLRRGG